MTPHTVKNRRNTDKTVANLKSAVIEQLISQGFSGLSIQPIIKKANVPKGGLFHHFPTKNHLIAATFAELLQQLEEGLREIGHNLQTEKISRVDFVEQVVDHFSSDIFIGCMEVALGLRRDPSLAELIDDDIAAWRGSLSDFWKDTFELKDQLSKQVEGHWEMASNLLRGHSFSSTFGIKPQTRQEFCTSFEKMILSQAVVKKPTL